MSYDKHGQRQSKAAAAYLDLWNLCWWLLLYFLTVGLYCPLYCLILRLYGRSCLMNVQLYRPSLGWWLYCLGWRLYCLTYCIGYCLRYRLGGRSRWL